MRHGRAKAARKALRYFERTVNLSSKPYYSVLLDATFLIAMIRITSDGNSNEGPATAESTIVSRIERVLQVNSGSSSFSGSRDARLSGVVGGYDNHDQSYTDTNNYDSQHRSNSNNNNNSGSGHFARYNVRYFIPQEAVDELETIIQTFQNRSDETKKPKKQRKYQEKSKVFQEALAWIKTNSSKKHSHRGSGRCEVLPKLEALARVEPPTKKQKRKQHHEPASENGNEPAAISASDAVRRHIARDDGRETPETHPPTQSQTPPPPQGVVQRTYIVASQEEDLLDGLRMLGTVPILRCANNASVLILENPSKKGQRTDSGREQLKWRGALQNPAEKALVDAAWEAQKKRSVHITGAAAFESSKRGASNRAKGPNPLSCKRKRANGTPNHPPQKQGGSGEKSKSQKRRARAQRNKEESSAAAKE